VPLPGWAEERHHVSTTERRTTMMSSLGGKRLAEGGIILPCWSMTNARRIVKSVPVTQHSFSRLPKKKLAPMECHMPRGKLSALSSTRRS
jgi:hypothetical protein